MAMMGLPLMPGCNELFHGELLRKNFRKAHTLAGTGKDGGGKALGFTDAPRSAVDRDTLTVKEGSSVCARQPDPAHMALDRKVLRFKGFFMEEVSQSKEETSRPRKCVVYYFLEDGTVCIVEPRCQNAGMTQGTIVRRHQVPKADGSGPVSMFDLVLGGVLHVYGKFIHLYDCDAFSRTFLADEGIEVGEPLPEPVDGYMDKRKGEMGRSIPRREGLKGQDYKNNHGITGAAGGSSATREEVLTTTQFLHNDRKVLRFKACWDDRSKLNGDHRLFHLYYFLADDSIEVTEMNPQNSGQDPFPSFVRRQRIIKQETGHRFANPKLSLSFKKEETQFWKMDDLRIGATVTIFGRAFFIYDCDSFTRDTLLEQGVPKEELQALPVAVIKRPTPRPPTPPHNGFGDPEDSLANCRRLAVKVRTKDTMQFINKSGCNLKFSMRLVTDEPTDQIRRFVVTYYLDDDTCSIFEPAVRNSGILGGKFLQRQRVKLGDGDTYAKPEDFFVGAVVKINKHTFCVLSTDERSLCYMEQNPRSFDKSNINVVVDKIRAMLLSSKSGLRSIFDAADKDGSGKLDFDELCATFKQLGLPVCEHEVLTLMRYFDKNGDGEVSYGELVSRIVPGEGGEADMGDKDWEEIFTQWQQKVALAENEVKSEEARAMRVHETRAAQAMQSFLREYARRKMLFQEEFRAMCDRRADDCMNAAGFRHVVEDKLQLAIPQKHLDELCRELFPVNLQWLPYAELLRLLDSTSNYSHTAKAIGRFRPRDRGFRFQ
eukprot:Hpha_TRINITY_DN15419_c0_g7::TRINITY_DN15419_c0_g7_i1::g.177425::m.177425